MSRIEVAFGALLVAQAIHSVEEYLGRLWESYPPARFLTGLVSADHERAFVVLNVLLLAFGLWCLVWPVRGRWPVAGAIAWSWVVVEIINGMVHPLWSVWIGGYSPGVLTAPMLFILAIYLARQLRQTAHESTTAT